MTVSSTSSRVVYSGNGATTSWPFAFKVPTSAELVVVYTDADGVDTTVSPSNYTATGFGVDAGGTVTYPLSGSPIATGTHLTIYRSIAPTQPSSISNQGAFWPTVVEAALDRLTMIVQGFLDLAGRAVVAPVADSAPSMTLPIAALRANKVMAFDADGNAAVSTLDLDDIEAAGTIGAAAAAAAAASATAAASSATSAASSATTATSQASNATTQATAAAGSATSAASSATTASTAAGVAISAANSAGTSATNAASSATSAANSATAAASSATNAASSATTATTQASNAATSATAAANSATAAATSASNAAASAAVFTGKNRLINGSMRTDQRNQGAAQTFTAAAAIAYCVDRWYGSCTGANITGQRVAGTGANQYAYRFTGATSNTGTLFGQRIEATNIYDLKSGNVTCSLKAKSSTITTVTWTAYYATVADTFSSKTQIATGTLTISSTLSSQSFTFNAGADADKGIAIEFTTGALVAAATLQYESIQLEAGSAATSFEVLPIDRELQQCRRYLPGFKATATSEFIAHGHAINATSAFLWYQFDVEARIPPTGVTASSAGHFACTLADLTQKTCSVVATGGGQSKRGILIDADSATSGLTTGDGSHLVAINSSASLIFTGAEL